MLNIFNKASKKLTNYFSFFEDKIRTIKKDIIESLIRVTPNIFIWIEDKDYTDDQFINLIISNFQDNYQIYNLIPKKIETKTFAEKIVDFKLPNNPSYTLEFLINFCISAENFLSAKKENVLVLHDDITKNGRLIFYLTSVLITYSCNKNNEFGEPVTIFNNLVNAFKENKYFKKYLTTTDNKNNIRYLDYFSSILKSPLITLKKIFLSNIIISGVPAIDNDENNANDHFVTINKNSYYIPVVRIKSNEKYVYSSYNPNNESQKYYYLNDSKAKFEINKYIFSDVCIEILHKSDKIFKLLFVIQFNSFFLDSNCTIKFNKDQIDSINNDIRYPNDFNVNLIFDNTKEEQISSYDEYSIVWKKLLSDFITKSVNIKNENDNKIKENEIKKEENKEKNIDVKKNEEIKEELKEENKEDKEEDILNSMGNTNNTLNQVNDLLKKIKGDGILNSNKEDNVDDEDDDEDIDNYLKNLENK